MGQGCKKALDLGPSKVTLNDLNVYSTDGGAQSVVAGLYMRMSNSAAYYNGSGSLSLLLGLASDELVNPNPNNQSNNAAYLNNYTATISPAFWTEIYREIFVCNLAIKGMAESTLLTSTVKQQMIAELKFIRAFNYFYAVNLYGDVPMPLTDDYELNNTLSRMPAREVYDQIIKDLLDAQGGLADNKYVNGSGTAGTERVRPNKQVATAMLARVYLYLGDWKNAEAQASALIGNANYILEPNLNQVFLKGSKEVIWQLQPVSSTYINTADGYFLIINNNSFATNGQLPLSNLLTQSFQVGDNRVMNWTGQYQTTTTPSTLYNFALKYKISSLSASGAATEYPMVLRLAEQYLIRAEARANQDNLNGAAEDVNAVRRRAGLVGITVSDKTTMFSVIERERKFELFGEWGHRWFDLKRTGRLNAVMTAVSAVKGGSWADYKSLFPIPVNDILANPNITQTKGY